MGLPHYPLHSSTADTQVCLTERSVVRPRPPYLRADLTAVSSPRMACRHGKPWPFSTAKLESRGKPMKGIVLKQSSARPTSSKADIVRVTNPARGGEKSKKSGTNKTIYKRGAYTGNQMATVLAKATMREELNLSASGRPQHRRSEQLKTLGKSTIITTVKKESDRDARWVGKVPEHVPFTVVGLLLAAVQGVCAPLYKQDGKHRANPLPAEEGFDVFGS